MLKEENLSERIMIAIRSLNKVRHLLRIQTEIENKTHYDLDEQQKEYFLKQQIKNIREELGEGKEGGIEKGMAYFDGAAAMPMVTGDRIRIEKSTKATRIIKINNISFLETLRKKMRNN